MELQLQNNNNESFSEKYETIPYLLNSRSKNNNKIFLKLSNFLILFFIFSSLYFLIFYNHIKII